jgi:hypothetical protein
MARRRKRFADSRNAGRSELVPFQPGEDHRTRHARRLRTNLAAIDHVRQWAADNGLTLNVGNHGHHWKFTRDTFVVEWWPSTAKLVFDKRYREGIHVHDYVKAMELIDAELAKFFARRVPRGLSRYLVRSENAMGRYGIVIVGVGPHHNPDNHTDADKMAHTFVNKLREAGHTVEIAQIEIEGGALPEALQHDVELKGPFFGPHSGHLGATQGPAANYQGTNVGSATKREPTIGDQAAQSDAAEGRAADAESAA